MGAAGKRVAILVANNFEQSEFEEPLKALRAAGIEVRVIATTTKTLQGLHHTDKGATFQADELIQDADAEAYDALVLPGGAINADALRTSETAQQWTRHFIESGKPLAAICHAPWLLVSAELVKGRRLTSFPAIQDDIRNAGGEWVDEEVVVDDNLITSRRPNDIPAFNRAILDKLDDDL